MLNPRHDLTPCERADTLPFARVSPTPRAAGHRRPCAADPARCDCAAILTTIAGTRASLQIIHIAATP